MSNNANLNMPAMAAYDAQSLDKLKLQARRDPDKAAGAVAKQFEALFVNMVLKSMREATPQDGMFDNDQSRLYTSMLDQQLAQQLASRGIGLAAALTRQLSREPAAAALDPAASLHQQDALPMPSAALSGPQFAPRPPAIPEAPEPQVLNVAVPPAKVPSTSGSPPAGAGPMPLKHTRDFVNRVWSHAVDAARSIGIQPHFMVGQAALESGWGRHEIRAADGSATHNIFGIKAGRSWKGPTVEKATTEYVNGVAHRTTAKFRVYASYGEAFSDYAKFLRGNPRYANVAQAQDAKGFARSLQQSGYATDPAYADKLTRIINGNTLRQSLIG